MTLSPIAALVRRHDPDRFLTALFAPAERRDTLLLLYAANHELARAREVASEPTLALIRLHWWREVVLGARRRHEVAGPLGEALDAGLVHAPELLAMIDAREVETDAAIPSRAAWLAYVDGTAGTLAAAAGRVLGADAPTQARLRGLGTAYGITGQIRNVGALARQGRCLLPQDVLGAHGLTIDQVIAEPALASPALDDLRGDAAGLIAGHGGRFPQGVVAAALPAILARRDLGHPPGPRGLGDKLAVTLAGLTGRV